MLPLELLSYDYKDNYLVLYFADLRDIYVQPIKVAVLQLLVLDDLLTDQNISLVRQDQIQDKEDHLAMYHRLDKQGHIVDYFSDDRILSQRIKEEVEIALNEFRALKTQLKYGKLVLNISDTQINPYQTRSEILHAFEQEISSVYMTRKIQGHLANGIEIHLIPIDEGTNQLNREYIVIGVEYLKVYKSEDFHADDHISTISQMNQDIGFTKKMLQTMIIIDRDGKIRIREYKLIQLYQKQQKKRKKQISRGESIYRRLTHTFVHGEFSGDIPILAYPLVFDTLKKVYDLYRPSHQNTYNKQLFEQFSSDSSNKFCFQSADGYSHYLSHGDELVVVGNERLIRDWFTTDRYTPQNILYTGAILDWQDHILVIDHDGHDIDFSKISIKDCLTVIDTVFSQSTASIEEPFKRVATVVADTYDREKASISLHDVFQLLIQQLAESSYETSEKDAALLLSTLSRIKFLHKFNDQPVESTDSPVERRNNTSIKLDMELDPKNSVFYFLITLLLRLQSTVSPILLVIDDLHLLAELFSPRIRQFVQKLLKTKRISMVYCYTTNVSLSQFGEATKVKRLNLGIMEDDCVSAHKGTVRNSSTSPEVHVSTIRSMAFGIIPFLSADNVSWVISGIFIGLFLSNDVSRSILTTLRRLFRKFRRFYRRFTSLQEVNDLPVVDLEVADRQIHLVEIQFLEDKAIYSNNSPLIFNNEGIFEVRKS